MAQGTVEKGDTDLTDYQESLETLELLVIHLLEEISLGSSSPSGMINQQVPHDLSPNESPPIPITPIKAKSNFRGSLNQLELLISLKQACIYRTKDQKQIEIFEQEIEEIQIRIDKIKGRKH